MLEFAVLGLLHESPMHGYELRTRLRIKLGAFRAFSYGSLYPTLRRMRLAGWITEEEPDPAATAAAPALAGRRGKVVYRLTPDGKQRLADLLAQAGPEAYDDEAFGVHFAFFAQTDADVRLRILEGRRRRVEERRDGLRSALGRTRERLDRYTLELQKHGLDAVEREVRWLNELIDTERRERAQHPTTAGPTQPAPPRPGAAEPAPPGGTDDNPSPSARPE